MSPRKGGARFYVANGMPREAPQELGGWRSSAVMEEVYVRARSEEAVPEAREAATRACRSLEVERFVADLDREVCVDASEALGADMAPSIPIDPRPFGAGRGLAY